MGQSVEDTSRVHVIREDTFLKGEIRNGGRIEVFGYVEGDVAGDLLIVQPGGRCYGKVKVESADVRGDLQGDIVVRQLITIRGSGVVTGNVKYGKLSMEMGGALTAEMRNIPPSISGDLDISVDKGKAVRITLQDLSAFDPDDVAEALTFTVSQVRNGFVTLAADPGQPVGAFTQADLERGAVLFRHDGTDEPRASFAVVVADRAGATSGAAQTVNVAVRA
jgi:cytoskeletal protein CcmA (bactofilin family)